MRARRIIESGDSGPFALLIRGTATHQLSARGSSKRFVYVVYIPTAIFFLSALCISVYRKVRREGPRAIIKYKQDRERFI